MAKYSNTVEYNIKTTLDKTGIAQLQSQLRLVENEIQTLQAKGLISPTTVKESIGQVNQLKSALNSAFNSKLGMLDNKAFMNSINKMQGGLSGIYTNFSKLGATGMTAFSQIYGQIGKIDTGLKQVSNTSDKIMNTLGNTVRWGLIASVFANVMNSAHQSVEYVKELDESLTNIMMVTGYSRDMMNEYARSANEAAKALGSTTTAMTNAALVFAQQGYDVPTSQKLAESSTKLANVSQQDTAAASDEITAYMNAFKIPLEDIDNALSKWAKVANVSAADVEELSVASQKAASTANTVGVNMDQLAAQIAAIETVTREAPENIGNGLKTLYARFSDIGMGDTLDDGVNLGKVTSTLQKVGVDVLTAEGNMRQVGDIMEDLMEVWGGLDLTQRSSIATTLAGKFQLSRFTSLMNRSDLYKEYLGASENETGTETLDMMQDVFENSMQGRLNKLQATVEDIFANAFETDNFYNMIDAVTQLVQVFADLTEAIGGGGTALTAFAAIAARTFSGQIGQGISNFISNRQNEALGAQNIQAAEESARAQLAGRGLNVNDTMVQQTADATANVNQYAGIMSAEQIEKVNAATEERINLLTQQQQVTESLKDHTIGLTEVLASQGVEHIENATQLKVFIQQLEDEGIKVIGNVDKFNTFKDALRNAQSAQATFSASVKDKTVMTEAGYSNVIIKAEQLQEKLLALIKTESLGSESVEVLTKAYNNLDIITNGNVKSFEQLKQILSQNEQMFFGISRAIQSVSDIGGREVEVLRQEIAQREALTTALQRNIDAANGYAQSLNIQRIATGITQLASAGMTVAFTFQALRGLKDVLTNEDLDPFERFEQIMLNGSMVAAMAIPTVKELKTAFADLRGALSVLNTERLYEATVSKESAAALTAETAAQEYNTRTKIMNSLATEHNGVAKVAAANAIEMEMLSEVALTDAKIAEIAVTNDLSVAEVESIAARMGAARATDSLTASLGRQIAAIAIAHPIITAVVVTLSALAIGLKFAADAYHADARAAEEAQETSKQLNSVWSDSKERLNTLNTALEELETHKETLSALQQGTSEWNEELQATNDLILDLIEKYPQLAQYVHRNGEGVLEIGKDEEGNSGTDVVKKIAETQEAQAHASALMAQAAAAQKTLRSDATDLARDITWTTTTKKQVQTSIPGQYKTEDVEETSSLTSKQVEDLANYMAKNNISANDLTAENIKEAIGVDSAADKIVEAIHDTSQDNIGALESFSEQQEATKKANELRISEALANNIEGYDVNNPYGERLTQAYNDAYKEAQNRISYDQLVSLPIDQLANEFLQKHEGEYSSYTVDDKLFGEKDDTATFTDSSGNTLELTRQSLEQAIASEEALQAAAEEWESVAPAWKAAAEHAGDLVGIFDGKGGFNPEGLAELDPDKTYDLGELTKEDIHTLGFDDVDTPEQLRDLLQTYLEEHPIKATLDTESIKEQLEGITADNLDSDIELEEFQALSKYLADNAEELEGFDGELEENADLVKEVAEEMLEYNSALERAQEHMEDWEDMLASGAVEDQAKAASELNEVYKDLFDLADDTDLSAAFTTDPENLELLRRVMEGDIEAYDELAARAAQDILIHAGVDTDTAQADVAHLQALIDQSNYNEIEIGAHVDSTALETELNEIIAAAGMTADQAESLLASMGLEAELEQATQEAEDPITYTGLEPVATGPVPIISTYPVGDGKEIKTETAVAHVSGVTMRPVPATTSQRRAMTAFGLRVQGSKTGATSGGGVKIKHGSVRKAATGAAKYANASHGGGASHPVSSGGGGGGGKGGGGKGGKGGKGGGGKAEEPKDVARKEAGEVEKNIYEKIDAWLEKLQDDYSKLKKARNNAWGQTNLIKNANKELGLLQAQTKALKDRVKISQEYQKALLGDAGLKEKYNVKNSLDEYGLTDKDLDGVVDNYSQQWDIAKKLAEKAQKEADAYFKAHGGKTGKDKYDNEVVIKDAKMTEAQSNRYEELTKTAENAWEVVKQINDVTKDYEDTADKIRDDEEEQLDLLYEMDEIQIKLYERSLDALDTLEEMSDMMAKMKGMWSGFELDSPFRAMVEDVQEIEDLFAGDTKQEINDYYNNIYNNIAKNDRLTKAQKNEAKKFFQQQQANATSANGYNDLGFGELARESRKLAELQAMEKNTAIRDLVYGPTQEGYEQWLDELEEQTKKVEELALSAEEAWKKAQENTIDALDEEMDKLDKIYDKYNDIIDRVEREADRISLFHGEDQYNDLSKLADQAGKVQLEKAKKYQQEYNYWEQKQNNLKAEEEKERNRRIAKARDLLNNASNAKERANAQLVMEEAKQYHSDEWEWYDEKMREAQENVLDAQDEAAESFKKAYELAIDEIEAKWFKTALGTRDVNYLEDDWNRDKDYMTTYKDDYERNYEVQKLNYKWQEMLNDALGSSLATQRKIRNEGQQIVDQLANQVTMSEYDVKLANARLEILQKQIALENAQQNKNQMKLRRDTQGNYKYVYAADQDDIGEKQQDLLDSLYNVWEISKEQSIDSTDNYIAAVQQASEKAKEIWNDASLTVEQKQALIAELTADTGRLLEAIAQDAGDSFNGMISAVTLGAGIGLENVSEMSANVLEALLTHNAEAIEGIGVPWDKFLGDLLVPEDGKSNIPGIAKAFSTAMGDCKKANEKFLNEIQGPNGVAAVTGEEYGKASTVIKNTTTSTNALYNETLKLYTLFGLESKALDQAKKTLAGYKKQLDAATSGSGAFAKQVQAANKAVVDAAKASGNWITAPEKAAKTAEGRANPYAFSGSGVSISYTSQAVGALSSSSGGGGGGGGGDYGGGGGSYSGGGGGTPSSGSSKSSGYNLPLRVTGVTKDSSGKAHIYDAIRTPSGYHFRGGFKPGYFATGGYTGSWSDNGVDEKNGKWAILHQKELVLNAADTKNILTAVELVRQTTDSLKTASLSDAVKKSNQSIKQSAIDSAAWISQPVTISAEFPNANSVTEIREALLSLTDAASQYAYRDINKF